MEGNFAYVWVVGEVSNCTRAGSGHIYLTLKDEAAQIRAVVWRGAAARLRFDIQDGLEVVAAGPIEVYAARGGYQLIVEQMLPQGVGALELAFRQLRDKLEAEGLFSAERKQPLPRFPRKIAIITSPAGAALRDILQVIGRRWPLGDIVILPVAVQGVGAADEIAAALGRVSSIPAVDVVITGRGGGSLEDLWAFNEEVVARAIFNCPVPVVSAVGHEIDVTIADFVADRRALTPSEAGELVVPHCDEILAELQRLQDRLRESLRGRAAFARMQLDALARNRLFTRPLERVHDLAARLDDLEARLHRGADNLLDRSRRQVEAVARSLAALSPLNVLERGYSITCRLGSPEPIRTAEKLEAGVQIETRLHRGRCVSRVESIELAETFDGPPDRPVNDA